MKDLCEKHNITEKQFIGDDQIFGSLYLRNLTAIPEGFNPTVGGSLYLRNLTAIPEGFNPTVGGSLDLGNLTSIPEGFNPTVGGSIDLGNLNLNRSVQCKEYGNQILSWENGKYILCDGIFTEVLSKKRGYYLVGRLHSKDKFYIVIDGKDTHAHGKSLKEANEALQFKIISEKLKKEPIKADTIITDKYYRLITGACEFGVKEWRERNGFTQHAIKAKELFPLLEKSNAYGFEKFKSLISF